MTSDMAQGVTEPSAGRKQLALALGEVAVRLSDLSLEEFQGLFTKWLGKVHLEDLRGFRPMYDVLSRRGDGSRHHPAVSVSKLCRLHKVAFDTTRGSYAPGHKTQMIRVSNGIHSQELIFRRYESGEETTDWKTAESWGQRGYYVARGKESVVLMWRYGNHQAYETLVHVTYHFEKIPHQNEFEIHEIEMRQLLVQDFVEVFGDKAFRMANEILNEIRYAYRRTLDSLEGKARLMQRDTAWWDMLVDRTR